MARKKVPRLAALLTLVWHIRSGCRGLLEFVSAAAIGDVLRQVPVVI